MNLLNRFLFTRTDNASLLIFRIFFGILIACECYGAIVTGWVKNTLIDPKFTFNFIGFEWLQPLPGYGMYIYFFIMGTLGICISLGYKYRFSIISFTILWTGVYLMQKTSYNNHYYLLILISGMKTKSSHTEQFNVQLCKMDDSRSTFLGIYLRINSQTLYRLA